MWTFWLVLLALALGAVGGWWIGRPRRNVVDGLARRSRILYELAEGDRENVARELEEVCEQEPSDAAVYLALAALDRRRGRHERAKAIHRTILASADLDAEHRVAALVGLGRDLLAQGKEQAAVGALHRAASLSPRSEATLQTLAFALEEAGAWGRAATAWERLEKLARGRSAQRARIGRGHAMSGQAEQALAEGDLQKATHLAERAVVLAPESGHSWTVRARIEGQLGRGDAALSAWLRAWEFAPDLAFSLVPEAMACARALNLEAAFLKKARELLKSSDKAALVVALADLFLASEPELVEEALSRWELETTSSVQLATLRLRHRQRDLASLEEMLQPGRLRPALSCRRCGMKIETPRFRCPRCGSWDSVTMEGVRPERRFRLGA